MNKTKGIIILIISFLLIVVGVMAYINYNQTVKSRELYNDSKFILKDNGDIVAIVNMKEISQLGKKEFKAILDTSSTDPIEYTYTGVLFKDILQGKGININNREAVVFKATDGYTTCVSIDKILEEDNVYLAYQVDEKPLGTIEDGGRGPFMMIISKDSFSQYWCKYAIEADCQ